MVATRRAGGLRRIAAAAAVALAGVTGGASGTAGAAGTTGCTWAATELPTLGGAAIVNGTDNAGTYYGIARDGTGRGHLVTWRDGTLTDVNAAADWAAAFGNAAGVVAGTVGAADGSHHGALLRGGAVVRLKEPPGTYISEVTAVDADGNLLGDVTAGDWLTHAVVWPAGAPDTVRVLDAPGGTASGAMAAADGRISGFAGASGYVWATDGTLVRKVVPTGRGDIVQLKTTSGRYFYGTQWVQADGAFRAIAVDAGGRLSYLPDGQGTAALAANAGGDVAGRDTQHGPALIWTGGARIDLPSLPGLPNGFPMALSTDRTVAGALYDDQYRTSHAALWACK